MQHRATKMITQELKKEKIRLKNLEIQFKVVEDKYFNGLVRFGLKKADDTRIAIYNETIHSKMADSELVLLIGGGIVLTLLLSNHQFFGIIGIFIVLILYSIIKK